MKIMNIAGYKFISLLDLEALKESLQQKASSLALKGTILLSQEGINISLSGSKDTISHFVLSLKADPRFLDMTFHETYSDITPFKRLKVKLKKEIITLLKPDAQPTETVRAPAVTPQTLKQWLDKKEDIHLFDTRNKYEVQFGTFEEATHLPINEFNKLPAMLNHIPRDKPIVMFCTGGIRCEKAALYMLQQGYEQVYQLEGGILGYFAEVGGIHYQGECFVFDERISIDSSLNTTGTKQCVSCQGPISSETHSCFNL